VAGKAIGILALQGDVGLHAQALAQLGMKSRFVKTPAELAGLTGLIIPGGESTALLRLCEPIDMLGALMTFAQQGGSIFGTCAGAILLAKTVSHPKQHSLGLLDISIQRNGYGRQLDSQETYGRTHGPLGDHELALTFIRAPRITRVGPAVETLATYEGEPVLVAHDRLLAATFHPELTDDLTVYRHWLTRF